jgi:O-acetyl-ADP-ribose deacetylase (regulator of RNase III)
MISYINQDITKVPMGIIVHGVNCQGVMGSGVARAIRDKWPTVYDHYIDKVTKDKDLTLERYGPLLGSIQLVTVERSNLYVINAFTQDKFGKDGKRFVSYDAVDSCFKKIFELCKDVDELKDLSVYIPQIGAGLGGGNWRAISAIIEQYYDIYPITCCIKK